MRNPLLRAFLAALLLGCTGTLSAATKIGVLLKGKAPFWTAVEKGSLEAGQAAGSEVIVKSPMSESDISVQIQLLNGLAEQLAAGLTPD